jgi:heme a synthase
MSRLPTVSARTYELVALVALVTLGVIVLTGAAVRLTGSGLGCPGWPKCGEGIVAPLETHAWIEFGNRLVTGVVGLPCLAAFALAWRRRPFRRDLVVLGALLPLGVLAQAILGGITVLTELRAEVVMAHFLLSMVLLAAAVALAWRARFEPEDRPAPAPRQVTLATRALLAWGAVSIFAGTAASAAGPHAGSAGTGEVVPRLDFWGAETLDALIHWHGRTGTVLGLAALATWFLARRRGAGRHVVLPLTIACLGVAAQGLVGFAQYELALPATLVWLHVVIATGTWIALLYAVAGAGRLVPRARPLPPGPDPAPAERRELELVS